MMLPKPVYESLPAFYIAIGIAAIIAVDSFMSVTSGILLGLSGLTIFWLRYNYRSLQACKQNK